MIFVRVFEPSLPGGVVPFAITGAGLAATDRSIPSWENLKPAGFKSQVVPVPEPADRGNGRNLESVVPYLPWFWLGGSLSTLLVLATGLVGVEQLRRSSRVLDTGEIPGCLRALADSLGIARRVSIAVCEHLAVPVLIGIVRPAILVPPAALCGWSARTARDGVAARTSSRTAVGQPNEPGTTDCRVAAIFSSGGVVALGMGAAGA